jgi:hypothetical protein
MNPPSLLRSERKASRGWRVAKRTEKRVVSSYRPVAAWLSCVAAMLAAGCTERAANSIRTAAAEERNALLLQAIRDAGYLCEEIIDATAPADTATGWRVLCTDMLVYLASLDTNDALHIEPIAYGDPARAPISRNPDDQAETLRPDP